MHLSVEVYGGGVDEPAHQRVPRAGIGIHERLGLVVMTPAAPFNRVARQRERRAGEANQRHRRTQRRADRTDGVKDVLQRLRVQHRRDAVDVGGGANRVVNHRSFALGEFQVEPQRLENQQNVREQNRGVDIEDLGRFDRHLRGQRGVFTEIEERHLRRIARYSGIYRPAWHMNQTGVTSVGSSRQALRKRNARSAAEGVGISRLVMARGLRPEREGERVPNLTDTSRLGEGGSRPAPRVGIRYEGGIVLRPSPASSTSAPDLSFPRRRDSNRRWSTTTTNRRNRRPPELERGGRRTIIRLRNTNQRSHQAPYRR